MGNAEGYPDHEENPAAREVQKHIQEYRDRTSDRYNCDHEAHGAANVGAADKHHFPTPTDVVRITYGVKIKQDARALPSEMGEQRKMMEMKSVRLLDEDAAAEKWWPKKKTPYGTPRAEGEGDAEPGEGEDPPEGGLALGSASTFALPTESRSLA